MKKQGERIFRCDAISPAEGEFFALNEYKGQKSR